MNEDEMKEAVDAKGLEQINRIHEYLSHEIQDSL